MRNFNKIPAVVICMFAFLASIVLIVKIRENTQHFKAEKNNIIALLNFNERLLDVEEAIPLYGDWVWENKYEEYQHDLKMADHYYGIALNWVVVLLLFNGLVLVLLSLYYWKSNRWFGASMGLLTVSLILLVTGIFTPLLELEAYKENLEIKVEVDAAALLSDIQQAVAKIPFVGSTSADYLEDLLPEFEGEQYKWRKVYPDKMYFFYENKGLFDVLRVLWGTGNYPIALIVGVFSFLVPCVKLMASFIFLFSPAKRMNRLRNGIGFLTKFSMLDVMVVSIFLTYFTFDELSTGVDTNSSLLMGVYFIAGYVLLAMIAGVTVDKYHDNLLANMQNE